MNAPNLHRHNCTDCGCRYGPCQCSWPDVVKAGRCHGCLQEYQADVDARLVSILIRQAEDALAI